MRLTRVVYEGTNPFEKLDVFLHLPPPLVAKPDVKETRENLE